MTDTTEQVPLREQVAKAFYDTEFSPEEIATGAGEWERWHEVNDMTRSEYLRAADAALAVVRAAMPNRTQVHLAICSSFGRPWHGSDHSPDDCKGATVKVLGLIERGLS